MDMEPGMLVKIEPNALGAVREPPIPEQHDVSPEVMQEVVKELHHLCGTDILIGMESAVQAELSRLGRNHNAGNGRDFGPRPCRKEDRGVSPRGPGPGNGRYQQESGLIKKAQVGPKYCGFFLSWATYAEASTGSRPRSVLSLDRRVFGNSIPGHASVSRHWQGYSGPRTSCGSRSGSASTSTCLLDTLPPGAPCSGCAGAAFSDAHSTRKGVRGKVADGALLRRAYGIPGANGRQSSARHLYEGPQPDRGGQPSRGGWRANAASRGSEVYRGVSCPTIYNIPR